MLWELGRAVGEVVRAECQLECPATRKSHGRGQPGPSLFWVLKQRAPGPQGSMTLNGGEPSSCHPLTSAELTVLTDIVRPGCPGLQAISCWPGATSDGRGAGAGEEDSWYQDGELCSQWAALKVGIQDPEPGSPARVLAPPQASGTARLPPFWAAQALPPPSACHQVPSCQALWRLRAGLQLPPLLDIQHIYCFNNGCHFSISSLVS